jgi:hypothetical protein
MRKTFLTKYDVNDIKTNFLIKKTLSEHSINCKKAKLKVLTESGTPDDLDYLYQESIDDTMGKLGAIIDDIIKKFIEFCKDIQIQILSKINSVEFKSNVQKINDKLKFNPFLRNKTQMVTDFTPKMKQYEDASSKLAKMVAKLKSGNSVSKDIDEFSDWFDGVAEGQMKSKKMTNAAIFASLKTMMEKVDGDIKDNRDTARKLLEDVRGIKPKNDDNGNDIDLKSSSTKICNYISRVSRAAIRLQVTVLGEYLAVCKREILNAKEEETKTESYYDYSDDSFYDTTYEYADDDFSNEYDYGYDTSDIDSIVGFDF